MMTCTYVVLFIAAIIAVGFLIVWPVLIWSHLRTQTKLLYEISRKNN